MMPTGERRFYLGKLLEKRQKSQSINDNKKRQSGKGKRTSTIGGDALKSGLKSGTIPLT
jgi:hypothetical protein